MTQARDEAAAAASAAAAEAAAAERASISPAQPLQEENVDAAAVVELEGQLEAVKTEVLTLQRANEALQTELVGAQEGKQQAEGQVEDLKAEALELQRGNETLQAMIATAQKKEQEAAETSQALTAKLQDALVETQEAQGSADRAAARVQALEAQLEHAETEAAAAAAAAAESAAAAIAGEREAAEEQGRALRERLEELQSVAAAKADEARNAMNEVTLRETRLAEVEDANRMLQQELQQVQASLSATAAAETAEVESWQARVAEAENANRQLQVERQQVEQELLAVQEKLRAQAVQAEETSRQLQHDLQQLHGQLQQEKEERREREAAMEDANRHLQERCEKQKEEAKEVMLAAKGKNAETMKKLGAEQQRVQEQQQQITALEEKLALLAESQLTTVRDTPRAGEQEDEKLIGGIVRGGGHADDTDADGAGMREEGEERAAAANRESEHAEILNLVPALEKKVQDMEHALATEQAARAEEQRHAADVAAQLAAYESQVNGSKDAEAQTHALQAEVDLMRAAAEEQKQVMQLALEQKQKRVSELEAELRQAQDNFEGQVQTAAAAAEAEIRAKEESEERLKERLKMQKEQAEKQRIHLEKAAADLRDLLQAAHEERDHAQEEAASASEKVEALASIEVQLTEANERNEKLQDQLRASEERAGQPVDAFGDFVSASLASNSEQAAATTADVNAAVELMRKEEEIAALKAAAAEALEAVKVKAAENENILKEEVAGLQAQLVQAPASQEAAPADGNMVMAVTELDELKTKLTQASTYIDELKRERDDAKRDKEAALADALAKEKASWEEKVAKIKSESKKAQDKLQQTCDQLKVDCENAHERIAEELNEKEALVHEKDEALAAQKKANQRIKKIAEKVLLFKAEKDAVEQQVEKLKRQLKMTRHRSPIPATAPQHHGGESQSECGIATGQVVLGEAGECETGSLAVDTGASEENPQSPARSAFDALNYALHSCDDESEQPPPVDSGALAHNGEGEGQVWPGLARILHSGSAAQSSRSLDPGGGGSELSLASVGWADGIEVSGDVLIAEQTKRRYAPFCKTIGDIGMCICHDTRAIVRYVSMLEAKDQEIADLRVKLKAAFSDAGSSARGDGHAGDLRREQVGNDNEGESANSSNQGRGVAVGSLGSMPCCSQCKMLHQEVRQLCCVCWEARTDLLMICTNTCTHVCTHARTCTHKSVRVRSGICTHIHARVCMTVLCVCVRVRALFADGSVRAPP